MCDLKAAQMNMQQSLIWELMLFKFELGHNAKEATKNICYAKGEGTADQSTVNREFKKFHSVCQILDDQVRSGRSKTMDSKTMLKANPVSSTQRVSGKLNISQSSLVCYLYNLSKCIQSCQIAPHVTKMLQNFWLTLKLELKQ